VTGLQPGQPGRTSATVSSNLISCFKKKSKVKLAYCLVGNGQSRTAGASQHRARKPPSDRTVQNHHAIITTSVSYRFCIEKTRSSDRIKPSHTHKQQQPGERACGQRVAGPPRSTLTGQGTTLSDVGVRVDV
jgi:hypothetical protein